MDANFLGDISGREAVRSEEFAQTSETDQAIVSARPLSVEICGAEIAAGLLRAAEFTVATPFECLAYARAFQPEIIPRLRHAVLHRERRLVAILSFYESGKSLVVINKLLRLPDDILADCAAKMLHHHPGMRSVEFDGLNNTGTATRSAPVRSFTWQTIDCAEAELPSSYTDFLESFGSTTRKNLRYCDRRLQRESPNVAFRILEGEQLTEAIVAEVVQLNHLRMASKGKTSGMDPTYVSRLAALCRSHGVGCVATDGSKAVAGTLCTRVGSGWTLHVIAHDPKFNHVRLGLLCLLRTVEEAIGGGAVRFNFLWGASDYKVLFGGKISALRARRYYRNMSSQLLSLTDIRDFALQSLRRQLSTWKRARRQRRAQ